MWLFMLMVFFPCMALSALAGYEYCRSTHRDCVEVTLSNTDPVPDHVPDTWLERV